MKIQYPGVAKGIESDINNLVAVMNVWNILPKGVSFLQNCFERILIIDLSSFSFLGMYVEEFITVAKRELSWEVDYVREAECTKKFAELLKDMPQFKIPNVIGKLKTQYFVSTLTLYMCFYRLLRR